MADVDRAATPDLLKPLNFGLPNAKPGVTCCGNPEPCTNTSPTCAFRNNPRKTAKFAWTPR